jgi:threonine/homoserine/homoserine lactone efflux protein
MIASSTLLAFVPAALAVVLAPGPDTMYALTRSFSGGRWAGVVAALGTATGVLVHTTAAVLGLSALLQTSATAYTAVKYLGAAYLVYLGVRTLRSDAEFDLRASDASDRSLGRSYRQAVAINVSNPKVAVFVLAFFPQFLPASAADPLSMSILGVVYATLSLAYLCGVAVFAGRIRGLLLDSERVTTLLRYASGSVLLGFGVKLAVEKRPGV